jgi:DnaA-like protein
MGMTKLLINEYPLMVLPSLASRIGLNESIVLQQIHYWLDPRINKNIRDGKHWVYNTYRDWRKQFSFWSEVTIKRIIQSLEKRNLLISSNFNKNHLDKTKWYTINYNKLQELEGSNSPNYTAHSPSDQKERTKESKRSVEGVKLIPSIYNETKTTTETTNSLSFDTESEGKVRIEKPVGERVNKNLNLDLEEEMLDIWNKLVEEERGEKAQGKRLDLTEKRRKGLASILSKSFMYNLDQWAAFCEMTASSKFLMGEITSFKATLDWVLIETNLRKILDGNYKMGDREMFSSSGTQTKKEIIDEIEREDTPAEWKEFKINLLKEVGEGTYKSWFSKLQFVGYSDGTLKIGVLTRFIKKWLEDRYSNILKNLLEVSFKGIEAYEVNV